MFIVSSIFFLIRKKKKKENSNLEYAKKKKIKDRKILYVLLSIYKDCLNSGHLQTRTESIAPHSQIYLYSNVKDFLE